MDMEDMEGGQAWFWQRYGREEGPRALEGWVKISFLGGIDCIIEPEAY